MLDQPHLRPPIDLLLRIKAELRKEPVISESGHKFTVEGINGLAKRLNVRVALLNRHFPEDCKRSIAKRKKLRTLLGMARLEERDQRLYAAAAAVTAQGLLLTERNLKRTGLLRVSDLVQKHRP
jgi:hypothetical protein